MLQDLTAKQWRTLTGTEVPTWRHLSETWTKLLDGRDVRWTAIGSRGDVGWFSVSIFDSDAPNPSLLLRVVNDEA